MKFSEFFNHLNSLLGDASSKIFNYEEMPTGIKIGIGNKIGALQMFIALTDETLAIMGGHPSDEEVIKRQKSLATNVYLTYVRNAIDKLLEFKKDNFK